MLLGATAAQPSPSSGPESGQFVDIIQAPSSNHYGDLKLQQTQPSAAERVQKLLEQECVEDLQLTALLRKMKLLAHEESFGAEFLKLYHPKFPCVYAAHLSKRTHNKTNRKSNDPNYLLESTTFTKSERRELRWMTAAEGKEERKCWFRIIR
ncbi:hypothetical protein ACTXT7_007037 [Hymenolepis weldensis]